MSEADDDRDLDAFLARRSPVSEAWRDAARESRAPDGLDAAILRTAAEAPAPAARPQLQRSRQHRWRLPIGLAASLLVGIGVLREVERDPAAQRVALSEHAVAAAPPAAAVESAADQAVPSVMSSAAEPQSPEAAERRAMARERDAAIAKRSAAVRQKQAAPPPRIAAEAAPAEPAGPPAPRTLAGASALQSEGAFAMRAEPSVADALAGAADVEAVATLVIGQTRLDEVRARFGEPVGPIDTADDGSLLLRYVRTIDPRGTLQLRFDADERRLVEIRLRVDPPLSPAQVRRDERLDAPASSACAHAADEPIKDPTARTLHWPSRGLRLLLDDTGHVIEIERRAACR